MSAKKKPGYRVIRFTLTSKLNPKPIEDFLNEGSEDETLRELLKEGNNYLMIMGPAYRPMIWPKKRRPKKRKV